MDAKSLWLKVSRKIRWIHRSVSWKVISLFSRKEFYRFTLWDGSLLDCPVNTSIAKMLFMCNFEKDEISFLQNSLQAGNIFLDVGANYGIYTILAGKLVGPQGHVYSFEPSRRELNVLKHNIEMNHLENVTVIEYAVSNHTGTTQLAIARDGGLNSFADTHRSDQKIELWQNVETTSLDEFVAKYSIPRVDFVKIDVEGAEKLVFEGAEKLLTSVQPTTVIFEASDFNAGGFGYTVKDFLNQILGRGMKLFVLGENGRVNRVSEWSAAYGNQIYNFVIRNHPDLKPSESDLFLPELKDTCTTDSQ